MRDATTRGFYDTVVRGAVDDIVRNLDSALDLGALAERSATSPFHFHRIFRGMVDETPLALTRRLRLERAAYWLATTDKSVATIAYDSGFVVRWRRSVRREPVSDAEHVGLWLRPAGAGDVDLVDPPGAGGELFRDVLDVADSAVIFNKVRRPIRARMLAGLRRRVGLDGSLAPRAST